LFANLLGVSASPRSVHVERGGRVPCSSSVIPGSGGRRRARTRFFVSTFSEAARLAVSERGLQLDRRPRFDAELDHFEEGLIGASPHGRAEAPNQRAASNAEHDGLVKQEAVVPAVRYLGVSALPRIIREGAVRSARIVSTSAGAAQLSVVRIMVSLGASTTSSSSSVVSKRARPGRSR
jgi:hypothetical protein